MIEKIFLVIKKQGPVLFPVTFFYLLSDQTVTQVVQAQLYSSNTNELLLWGLVGVSILVNFLFPLLMLVIVFAAIHNLSLATISQKLNFLFIEELRAWGISALWTLVFIIPGLIKMVQFLFVPLIVVSDSEYAQGQIDALEKSKKMTDKVFWPLSWILIIFTGILPLLMSPLNEIKQIALTPITAIPLSLLDTLINIFLYTLLVIQFDKALKIFPVKAHK
jgi:hypothetical protein